MTDFNEIDEQLSAYLDGELTQQESQKVDVMLRRSPELRGKFEDLRRLREQIKQLDYPRPTEAEWRNVMSRTTFKATRGLGWLLWIGAAIVLIGFGLYQFANDPSVALLERIGVFAMLAGTLLVFLTVLWERIAAYKQDKYKEVKK